MTTYSDTFESQPSFDLKALLAEPFLIVGAAAFWLITLPVAAVAIVCVRVWDAVSGVIFQRANPLILRRGQQATSSAAPAPNASASRRS